MKKRWRKRWKVFRQYYLVLTPEEKKVIAFICAAFALGLTAKCYRDAQSPPTSSPSMRADRPNESMSILPSPSATATPRKRGRPRKSPTPSE